MTSRKNPGFTSSRPRMFMFTITTIMFALGIAALVLVTTVEFKTTQVIYYPTFDRIYYYAWAGITYLMVRLLCFHALCFIKSTVVQYLLCDTICAWRTVVLWNKDKRVIAILLLFILGTMGA